MRETGFRELHVLCVIITYWCYCLSGDRATAECFPLIDCGDDGDYRQEQIQNVFKRFLFHYSKAQNSVGTVERESHSVHPLMRLSPKFTLRRKKQQVLSRHRG
ncbi:neuromedin-S isoform 2-T2 [Clarias gariepinus]|uniref:neuromedin-S isoform X2 n=1 Tax=Clarias gariepinus TaxID=13013 RepID=UPI00234DBFE1|nr:neuromedin-S isoform X2 [Clarias gariepinus]